jgi:hypothetical protein
MNNDSSNVEGDLKAKTKQHNLDGSDIFQSAGFRRFIQMGDELDRFLLDYGCNFLPYVSGFIYIILLLI